MLKQVLLSVALSFSLVPHAEAGVWDRFKNAIFGDEETPSPTIRVLILQDVDNAVVEVKGKYNLYDPYTNSKVATRFSGKANLMLAGASGIKWGEEFPGVFQLKIVPDDAKTTTLVNGIEYKGIIYVYDVGGHISIVNELPIDSYVSAILSPRLNKALSPEAMNAVVIAIRTDAYNTALTSDNPFWNVKADDVGYMGYAVTKRNNGVDEAVKATRNMVLSKSTVYRGQISPFPTNVSFAHENAGGKQGQIYIEEIEALAQKGQPADKILLRLYPDTHLTTATSLPEKK